MPPKRMFGSYPGSLPFVCRIALHVDNVSQGASQRERVFHSTHSIHGCYVDAATDEGHFNVTVLVHSALTEIVSFRR